MRVSSSTLSIAPLPLLEVELLPARALYWPQEATLFVADLHLGKPEAFHQRGIPIPGSVTGGDLERLSAALDVSGAQRLVILGDFFHARASQAAGVYAALQTWRAGHPALEVLLVAGNHDRHAGPPPEEFAIRACGLELQVGPFRCLHEPPALPLDGAGLTLCGHVHPMAVLQEGRSSARLPCFHLSRGLLTLPAFGTFTGGAVIRPRTGDGVWVIAGEQIFEILRPAGS